MPHEPESIMIANFQQPSHTNVVPETELLQVDTVAYFHDCFFKYQNFSVYVFQFGYDYLILRNIASGMRFLGQLRMG